MTRPPTRLFLLFANRGKLQPLIAPLVSHREVMSALQPRFGGAFSVNVSNSQIICEGGAKLRYGHSAGAFEGVVRDSGPATDR
jgi:hypothetical protein